MKRTTMLAIFAALTTTITAEDSAPLPNQDIQAFFDNQQMYYQSWNNFFKGNSSADTQLPLLLPDDGFCWGIGCEGSFPGIFWPRPPMPQRISGLEYLLKNSATINSALWPQDLQSQPIIEYGSDDVPHFYGISLPGYSKEFRITNQPFSGIVAINLYFQKKLASRSGFAFGATTQFDGQINGVQIGLLDNQAQILNGVQIGLYNSVIQSGISKGIQFGLFNDNGRILLPLLNLVY